MSLRKVVLDERAIPQVWYNLQADLPPLPPPLHPVTREPLKADDLADLSADLMHRRYQGTLYRYSR